MEIDGMERRFPRELDAHHHHAGDYEDAITRKLQQHARNRMHRGQTGGMGHLSSIKVGN